MKNRTVATVVRLTPRNSARLCAYARASRLFIADVIENALVAYLDPAITNLPGGPLDDDTPQGIFQREMEAASDRISETGRP